MDQNPSEKKQEIPTPGTPDEQSEKGPYQFPSKEDDPDQANDEPDKRRSNDSDDETGEDVDASGASAVPKQ